MNPLILSGVGVVAAIGLFMFGYHQGGLSAKVTAEADHVTQLSALAQAWQARELDHQTKETAYEKEVIGLQAGRVASPNLVVRLCPSPPSLVPAPGEGGQELPAATGVLSTIPVQNSQGRDVGDPLFSLADYADQLVAKCRSD